MAAESDLLRALREYRSHVAIHHLHPERQNVLTKYEDNVRLPDQWELQYFGTTFYGPTQDYDQDGTNNLAEWAFNLNPVRPDIAALTPGTGLAGLPVAGYTGSGVNRRLTIEFVRRKNAALT